VGSINRITSSCRVVSEEINIIVVVAVHFVVVLVLRGVAAAILLRGSALILHMVLVSAASLRSNGGNTRGATCGMAHIDTVLLPVRSI
jgi:hypothetical protein